MIVDKQLLSFRYTKDFFLNRKKYGNLNNEEKRVSTSSHSKCPNCDSTNGVLIAEVDRVGFPCDTIVCLRCDLVFNNSFIEDSIAYYSQTFGNERWKDSETNFLKRTSPDHYSWMRLGWVASTLGPAMKSVTKVLEIGCGDGCNLYPYHLLGKQVKGYDYGEEFLESGRRRGMNLVNGHFADDTNGPYDLILVVHTFEHLLELDQFVQQVLPLLAKDGRIYVEVPGIRNWNREQNMSLKEDGFSSSNNFLSYLQYQHNYHFDLNHLMEFWQRNGFEMIQ